MLFEKYLKIVLTFFIAIFCLTVAINNIIDYDVNFTFLKHIVTMDTMQPWFDMKIAAARAITNPSIHIVLYDCIIAGEFSAGLFALWASINMLKNINDNEKFYRAKSTFVIAVGLMLTVWYFGFNVIAANWFYMWANQYDASVPAFHFSFFALLLLIYILRDEKPTLSLLN